MADIQTPTVEVYLDQADWSSHLAEETARGLREHPAWIPPVWFYDERGSRLFDEITRLPEYYPTRAERSILVERADEIARLTAAETLIELGSGTSEKTQILISALAKAGTLQRLAPFDCSEEVLRDSSVTMARRYPGVEVTAVVGDFHRHLGGLPKGGTRLLAFLGSTIGNLNLDERRRFLGEVWAALSVNDWFLLGTDLTKDPDRLRAAYDDAQGVTAEFNRNCLNVMNRELGADFDPGAYRHVAHWNDVAACIEMRLVAERPQTVTVAGLDGLTVEVGTDEWIRTEISTKFTAEGVKHELTAAGLEVHHQWTDGDGDFLLTLARPEV